MNKSPQIEMIDTRVMKVPFERLQKKKQVTFFTNIHFAQLENQKMWVFESL